MLQQTLQVNLVFLLNKMHNAEETAFCTFRLNLLQNQGFHRAETYKDVKDRPVISCFVGL